MKRLEWYIAKRYLASRRRGRFLSLITLIAVGGIFVGVAALIAVIAVMTGLQRDLQAKILGSNPHVYVFQEGPGLRLSNWPDVLARVREVEGVLAAEPFVMTQVGIVPEGGSYAQWGQLYGIDPYASERPLTVIEEQIRAGELSFGPTQTGLPGALVGSRLANKLGLMPGDVVQMASLENIQQHPATGFYPVVREFEVTGTFTTGMFDYDAQNLYAPLSAVQDLVGLEEAGTVGGIAVNVADPWEADMIGRRISEELGYPYWTTDWTTLNASLFSALELEKLAMALILGLIVVVAAFNIISTLIMVVADKTREIGILKSMGLTDGGVLRIFMLQGIAIGLIGTALGAPLGIGLVWLQDRYELIKLAPDVYFVDSLPVALEPLDLALIVIVSVVVAFAATVYPARQASRLEPVEAIRHE